MLMTQRLSVMVMEVHEPQLDREPEAGNSLWAPAGPDISMSDIIDTGLNF